MVRHPRLIQCTIVGNMHENCRCSYLMHNYLCTTVCTSSPAYQLLHQDPSSQFPFPCCQQIQSQAHIQFLPQPLLFSLLHWYSVWSGKVKLAKVARCHSYSKKKVTGYEHYAKCILKLLNIVEWDRWHWY